MKNQIKVFLPIFLLLILFSCKQEQETAIKTEKIPKLKVENFGTVNGKEVSLYTINFNEKLKAKVTNYGCIITSLEVPDRDGKMADVVLGYDSLEHYVAKTPYFGAVLGRYGGRIADGEFSIEGKKYKVAQNNGDNHLHGGTVGFDKVVWETETKETDESVVLIFRYVSPNGEENYPGTLTATVTYTFTNTAFKVDYHATTDETTVINMTQHSYFNLSGATENTLNHQLQINATQFLELNDKMIPTGEFLDVAETPFDFRNFKKIGQDINTENRQLKLGKGYDHCFIIDTAINNKRAIKLNPPLAAALYHEESGRSLEVLTTEPGVQIYTANYLKGQFIGKNGQKYQQYDGVCLETQHFPDSPNQSDFPTVILKPNEEFKSTTIFRFGIQ